jgi:enoyl-CoA hydratase/carnithine racemase
MQFSPSTLALGKRAFYEQLGLDEPAAYSAMTSVMVDNALQPAAREGMHAFVEKRPPVWPDRLSATPVLARPGFHVLARVR